MTKWLHLRKAKLPVKGLKNQLELPKATLRRQEESREFLARTISRI
jgi:hypothetical protein